MTCRSSRPISSHNLLKTPRGSFLPNFARPLSSHCLSTRVLESFFFGFLSSEHLTCPFSLTTAHHFLWLISHFQFKRVQGPHLASSFLYSLSLESNIQCLGFKYCFPLATTYIYFLSPTPSPKVKGRFSAGVSRIH